MALSRPLAAVITDAKETISKCFPENCSLPVNLDSLSGMIRSVIFDLQYSNYDMPNSDLSYQQKEDVWQVISKLWVGPLSSLGLPGTVCIVVTVVFGLHR